VVTLSGSGGISYTWDNDVVNATPFSPVLSPVLGSNLYTVIGVDANGCENTATVTINLIPTPTTAFTATPLTGVVPLEVTFTNNSSSATTYSWDFGNGDSDVTSTPSSTNTIYTEPGEFTVVLVSDNGLCSSSDTTVIVVLNLPLTFNLPNIFTPNGDNSNDIMHLSLMNAKRVYVEIINRWGVQVGIIDSIDPNEGWRGLDMKSNKPVTEGVYFYNYEIEGVNGELISGHQFIHLKR
jgi:gliding motility-associated-like protein